MKFVGVIGRLLAAGLLISGCQTTGNDSSNSVVMKAPTQAAPKIKVVAVPLPNVQVGDTWSYSDGYGLKVGAIKADGNTRYERTDVEDQWLVRKAFFKQESQSRKTHRLVVFRTLGPMELISSSINTPISYIREYMRNDELIRHRTTWVIEGKERITVPAGTFDTWVMVMRTESLTSNWRGYERWYYSPEVNNYVRLEYKYGDAPDGSRVLMSYALVSNEKPKS